MKSPKEASLTGSQIRTEDKIETSQTRSSEKEIPLETTYSPHQSSTPEFKDDVSVDELKDYKESCSTFLDIIGNKQSKYLEHVLKLQEDAWDFCNYIIQNQLNLLYAYPAENSIKKEFPNPFLGLSRQSARVYLNSISLTYDYALLRTKIYDQIIQYAKSWLQMFYKTLTPDSQN